MKKQFNLFAVYGTDTLKEKNGVPFYLDKDSDCYISVARWCNRNVDYQREMADLNSKIQSLNYEEQEQARVEVFTKHLIKGWNNITDQNGNPLEFNVENALKLFNLVPDLVDDLVGFSLNRKNYPLDSLKEDSENATEKN